MSQRECGECTACCEGWLIASGSVDLRPGTGCQHCTAQGCGIYDDRPQDPCRDFACAWVQDDSPLPESMRPDQCGAIVRLDKRWRGWDMVSAIPVGERIPDETLKLLVEFARERQAPFYFIENVKVDGEFRKMKQLAMGPPEFAASVRDGLNAEDVVRF